MITFLLLNSSAAVSAGLLTARVLRYRFSADGVLAWFLLYEAQIILTELALGLAQILWLPNLLFLNALILLVVVLVCGRLPASVPVTKAGGALESFYFRLPVLLPLVVLIVFGTVKSGVNLVNPPFGWDSLNYHFTFAVEWLKNGNLMTPPVVFDDPSPPYYPLNGSLFYLWLMMPLRSVFVADLGQLPFFVVAVVAVYALGRKMDLAPYYSLIAALLFALIPNFFKQLQIAYVDVMVAALFLAGLNFLCALSESPGLPAAILSGISLGLLIGTKTTALPSALLLCCFCAAICLKKPKGLRYVGIVVLGIVCLGGFSYLRNLFETGNPLYPFDFRVAGIPVFTGVMDRATYAAHFTSADYHLGKMLFREGLGGQTLLFVFPFAVCGLPLALMRAPQRLNLREGFVLVLPLLLYLIFRLVIPLGNTRYLYPALGVGMVAGFMSLRRLAVSPKVIDVLMVLCTCASMAELAKRQELVFSLIGTLVVFVAVMLVRRRLVALTFDNLRRFLFGALIVIVGALILLEGDYVKNEFPRYKKMVKYSGFWPEATQAWEWLNRRTTGATIAYAGRPVPFPLYGSRFKNNVYYVSVNTVEPLQLHYFKQGRYRWGADFLELQRNLEAPENYRGHADYTVWQKNLTQRNVDYLFIYSLHQTKEIIFPIEEEWARAHPLQFVPVYANATVRIYKLIR